jgi:hypothetical protein
VTVVARSTDGLLFTPVCQLHRRDFGAESFERPVLTRTAGGWRLYLSCATPGSKHWWIEAVDAETVAALPRGRRTMVFPGDEGSVAVKDPVIVRDGALWHAWVCEHPLDLPGHEDRMSSSYWRSADGLVWERRSTALVPRQASWDARGARITDVLSLDPLVVLYDGRARADQNWCEVTGVATGSLGEPLEAADDPALRSPFSDGAARYAAHVTMPDGSVRFYLELARPDGAHDLVICVTAAP